MPEGPIIGISYASWMHTPETPLKKEPTAAD
jgi:hypothetical protein